MEKLSDDSPINVKETVRSHGLIERQSLKKHPVKMPGDSLMDLCREHVHASGIQMLNSNDILSPRVLMIFTID